MLFGMISPKIRRTAVPIPVAAVSAKGPSPNQLTAKAVTRAVNATLTRLFPSKMVDSSRSVLLIISWTRLAPGTLLFTRYVNRVFWRDKNAASELEKNPGNKTNIAIRTIVITISVGTNLPPRNGHRCHGYLCTGATLYGIAGIGDMMSILWDLYRLAGGADENIGNLMGTSGIMGIGGC